MFLQPRWVHLFFFPFVLFSACGLVGNNIPTSPLADQSDITGYPQDGEWSFSSHNDVNSIPPSSPLSPLAEILDKVSIERSVNFQNFQAALAERRALEFDRYPRVVPVGSVPIGSTEPSFGISLEQTIWDGGRVRASLNNSDLSVTEAMLLTWQERNQTIFDGLSAFVEVRRFSNRIELYTRLQSDLADLDEILRIRAEGGVADRGEQLRMSLSLQEVQRDIVSAQSKLRAEEAELIRLVPMSDWPGGDLSLSTSEVICSRDWPINQSPDIALSALSVMGAHNNYNGIRARRLPSLVLGTGLSYSRGSGSTPTAAFRLDASDMLGLGRKGSIESAEVSLIGARRSYVLQQEATNAELQLLDQEHIGYVSDISQLEEFQRTNRKNLDLYREQVIAGTIPIAEGISLLVESSNTDLDLIDVRSLIVQNCLESARLRGSLTSLSVQDE